MQVQEWTKEILGEMDDGSGRRVTAEELARAAEDRIAAALRTNARQVRRRIKKSKNRNRRPRKPSRRDRRNVVARQKKARPVYRRT